MRMSITEMVPWGGRWFASLWGDLSPEKAQTLRLYVRPKLFKSKLRTVSLVSRQSAPANRPGRVSGMTAFWVRSRYEITCTSFSISLRLLMPFRNVSVQLIPLQRLSPASPLGTPKTDAQVSENLGLFQSPVAARKTANIRRIPWSFSKYSVKKAAIPG